MATRRFPRNPELKPRPFDGGPNPFADDLTTPLPSGTNPLESPTTSDVQPYRPADFVETLPDRSNRVLFCGVSGAVFIGVSLVILAVVLVTGSWFSAELVYCWPADLLGLSLSIPAWVMGSSDLRAIQAGAMDVSGAIRTRIGYWCGCIGTLIGVAPFLLVVISIIHSVVS